jgi:hypothetical protein
VLLVVQPLLPLRLAPCRRAGLALHRRLLVHRLQRPAEARIALVGYRRRRQQRQRRDKADARQPGSPVWQGRMGAVTPAGTGPPPGS